MYSLSSPLIDIERNLALLLGLNAASQTRSLPTQSSEEECSRWIGAEFFHGGMQGLQPINPFEEEKGEVRNTGSSTATPGNALQLWKENEPTCSCDFDVMFCFVSVWYHSDRAEGP